jgi:hypothetical protein
MHNADWTSFDAGGGTDDAQQRPQSISAFIHRLVAELNALDHTRRTERFKQLPAELWIAVYAALPPAKQNRELAQCLALLR